jgi:hypothetical protein
VDNSVVGCPPVRIFATVVAMSGASGSGEAAGIAVQLAALESFAQAVDSLVDDHGHRIGVARTIFGSGIPFGQSTPSTEVQAAVSAYAETAEGMTDQIGSFYLGLAVLADAARAISDRYRSVDARQSATVNDIELIIGVIVGTDTPAALGPSARQYS